MIVKITKEDWPPIKEVLIELEKTGRFPTCGTSTLEETMDSDDWERSALESTEGKLTISELIFELENSKRRWGYDEISLDLSDFSPELVAELDSALNQKKLSSRSLRIAINGYHRVKSDPSGVVPKSLPELAMAIKMLIIENRNKVNGDGWLYRVREWPGIGNILEPYLVDEVEYHPGLKKNRGDRDPFVGVTLECDGISVPRDSDHVCDVSRRDSTSITFEKESLGTLTVMQLLESKGWLLENAEMKQEYLARQERFHKYLEMKNQQFWVRHFMYLPENDRDRSWRSWHSLQIIQPARVVQDMGRVTFKYSTPCKMHKWQAAGATGGFTQVPFSPWIVCFHLSDHEIGLAHVDCLEPYEYDTSIREKIVLPDHHRDLIEALTSELQLFADDVVAGKSGGVNILCVGPAGTGKTLTAEIYSEVTKRPLYRVTAAQLGINADEVEENLRLVMSRSQRWGAVLLLDEADVYVRARKDDVSHNAIVAAFLRSMEYFDGLTFMTSNRGGDIDDAIKSRCIATIRYDIPGANEAKRIWRIQSEAQKVPLNDALIDLLVKTMPRLSGRDIKELLKLTSKYLNARGESVNGKAFINCARFRDIEIVTGK